MAPYLIQGFTKVIICGLSRQGHKAAKFEATSRYRAAAARLADKGSFFFSHRFRKEEEEGSKKKQKEDKRIELKAASLSMVYYSRLLNFGLCGLGYVENAKSMSPHAQRAAVAFKTWFLPLTLVV